MSLLPYQGGVEIQFNQLVSQLSNSSGRRWLAQQEYHMVRLDFQVKWRIMGPPGLQQRFAKNTR